MTPQESLVALAGLVAVRPQIFPPNIGQGLFSDCAEVRLKSLAQALVCSVKHRDAIAMELAFAAGADPNARYESADDLRRMAAIHYAAENGDDATLKRLIARGAALNVRSDEGRTALHIAASKKRVECLQTLLACGAHVNSRDKKSITPVLAASESGSTECLALLIQHGARVDAMSNRFVGAVTLAVQAGSLGCVKLLVEAGASLEPSENSTSLTWSAARAGNAQCLRYLIRQGAPIQARWRPAAKLAKEVAEAGHLTCLKLLLGFGVKIKVKEFLSSKQITRHPRVVEYLQSLPRRRA